jgi:hypothetical protein
MCPGMQLSFLFDCDDVALPALKLDPDTELARVVPADVDAQRPWTANGARPTLAGTRQ